MLGWRWRMTSRGQEHHRHLHSVQRCKRLIGRRRWDRRMAPSPVLPAPLIPHDRASAIQISQDIAPPVLRLVIRRDARWQTPCRK